MNVWKIAALVLATILGLSLAEPGEPGETAPRHDRPSSDSLEHRESPAAPFADYPNEPPEYRLVASSRMVEPFSWPQSRPRSGVGAWWQWEEGDPNTSVLHEPGIPAGPAFNRTRFPAGLLPGRAPVNWGGWDGAAVQSGTEQSELYISKRIRLVGRDWDSHRVGTKLGFVGVGSRPGTAMNDLYLFLEGGLRSTFEVRAVQQGVVSRALGQNRVRGPVIEAGRWHQWEIRMVLNDLGAANGVLQWWIDGRLVMEHRDVVFRTAERPHGFLAYKWNPTWGGTGGEPKARDDHIDISDIRLSGRPLR